MAIFNISIRPGHGDFDRNLRGLGARTHLRVCLVFLCFNIFIGKCLDGPVQTFSCRCLALSGSCYVYGTQGYQFWTGIIKVAFFGLAGEEQKLDMFLWDPELAELVSFRDI